MAPITAQSRDISISPDIPRLIIGIVTGIIGIIILPFLATAIYIISMDIWRTMFKNRPKYLKYAKLRKEWNKAARAEQLRQETAKCIIRQC